MRLLPSGRQIYVCICGGLWLKVRLILDGVRVRGLMSELGLGLWLVIVYGQIKVRLSPGYNQGEGKIRVKVGVVQQWRIQSWSQGGFPKLANLSGWGRSVPASIKPLI